MKFLDKNHPRHEDEKKRSLQSGCEKEITLVSRGILFFNLKEKKITIAKVTKKNSTLTKLPTPWKSNGASLTCIGLTSIVSCRTLKDDEGSL